MTREIKFRVWDNDNKEWLNKGDAEDLIIHLDGSYEINRGWAIVKPDLTIEQYTGLKDKNGKEIYEGDIFRNTINGGTWRVGWDENGASFWVDSGFAGCSLGEFDWDRSNRKNGFIRKNCEVIGNIHENPELLEKGEE